MPLTIFMNNINDARRETVAQAFSVGTFDPACQGDFRQQSVRSGGDRGELGVILPDTLHCVTLHVDLLQKQANENWDRFTFLAVPEFSSLMSMFNNKGTWQRQAAIVT